MLHISLTLESIFKRYYRKNSKDFQNGFQECLRLLDVGISKHVQYNAFLLVEDLKKEKEALLKDIRERDHTIKSLTKKAREKSLYTLAPTNFFKEFKVAISDTEEFSIFTNMTQETFQNMSSNFAGRYKWTNSEECKAMMLQFINSKSTKGFKAYKDEKSASRDNVKIKR